MHKAGITALLAVGLTAVSITGPTYAGPSEEPGDRAPAPAAAHHDLGQQVLGANDGWASAEGGTTGGSAATAENVYRVSTWQGLREALGGNDARGDTTPRIVYLDGTVNANEAADGTLLTCADYSDPAYSLDAYLDQYDPTRWGANDPMGPLEEARDRSNGVQDDQVRQYIGSNVTLVGVGDTSGIVNASMTIRGSDNVIVRNLEIADAYDCFPAWDPNDSGGNWNSEFDNISILESTHVWIDHVSLNDGEHLPEFLPTYFGKKYEAHDGLLDITNGSDLVTLSWNTFTDHDKVMLIGSSDSRTTDRGALRVTLHHNLFENTGQRTPRVRFGQVHIYNNYYNETNEGGYYQYGWGAGKESEILAENNFFELGDGIDASAVIHNWGGTMLEESGSFVNGASLHHQVDLLAAYNADADTILGDSVTWDATHHERIEPTQTVPQRVLKNAGSGTLQ
ncbi:MULTISPECIES: polysaccharide lyase family 1 protein [unclassified Cryobacterium]|uniref:pectate lyase family protein n=1 Tax=unclassified Cryobacterium TaxID=2649013 RepID=UPI000CE3EA25|nr:MULTISPECIES: pectate lyase [unclassified Cryobacterium]